MAILAWVEYHHGDNRETPHMAARKDIVRFNAQIIETTERFVDPGLDIGCDAKAHRGKACVGAQRFVKSIQKECKMER